MIFVGLFCFERITEMRKVSNLGTEYDRQCRYEIKKLGEMLKENKEDEEFSYESERQKYGRRIIESINERYGEDCGC